MMTSRNDAMLTAQRVITRLWSAMRAGLVLAEDEYPHLFKSAYDPAWLQGLPLPIGDNRPSTQTIALKGGDGYERTTDNEALAVAYGAHKRTRIYESTEVRSGGWLAFVSLRLEALASCRVVCTLYESNADDEPTQPHIDRWFGALVQLRGAKGWQLGRDQQKQMLTECGDILLLPGGVHHAVWTPDYSVHLVCAFLTDRYL